MKYTQEQVVKAYGPYEPPAEFTEEFVRQSTAEIESFPDILLSFLSKLSPEQQFTCYREGGWSIRQVVHHIADSHMQAFSRFKLALTEHKPVIKPYIQNAWAGTYDSLDADALISARLLVLLHQRWSVLLREMKYEEYFNVFVHPEQGKEISLAHAVGLYAWHGRHHYTQIYRHAVNQGWI